MLLQVLALSLILQRPAQAATPIPPPPQARATVPAAIRVEKNVEYGRESGEPLLLDLYVPIDERPGLRPGVVFVHGGGWSGGDKGEYANMAREMAGRGYVAISVNYRLAPKHRYPAAVEDVERAVRWLKSRAPELRLDPERLASLGASAGGHLAAMLGISWRERPGASEPGPSVRCVVDYFGRMDLNLDPASTTGFTDYRPGFMGKSRAEAPERWAEASPITHVDSRTVPFLILQGTKDTQVEPAQSTRMLAALEKANVEVTLVLLGNQGHGFRGDSAAQAWDTAKAFLDRHLMR